MRHLLSGFFAMWGVLLLAAAFVEGQALPAGLGVVALALGAIGFVIRD